MDPAKKLPKEIAIKLLLGLGIVSNSMAQIAFAQQIDSHFILFRAMTPAPCCYSVCLI